MPRAVGYRILVLFTAGGRGYPGGMTRAAAHKLARLLRAQGYRVRVRRHRAERLVFYTVETHSTK